MSNFLWLDDVRPTPSNEGWDLVRDHAEFVAYVDTHAVPDLASLDHDLEDAHYARYLAAQGISADEIEGLLELPRGSVADAGPDGHDCVRYMVTKQWFPPTVVVHTMNHYGRKNMVNLLIDAGYHSVGHTAILNAFPASPVLRRFDADA